MSDDNVKSVIEALLFASEKPLLVEQVKEVLGHLEKEDIARLLGELSTEYEATGRGMRIVEVAGGFQMVTTSDFAPFLRKLFKQRKSERLSKSALETLAIIAYKQPVSRAEIGSIRSVNVDNMVKSLLDKGLIRVAGRKKTPGRPFVYATTRQFMEYFGLKSLAQLPKFEEFASFAQNKVAEIEAIAEDQNTEVVDESGEPAPQN
jgi:segregation and condensation protein B